MIPADQILINQYTYGSEFILSGKSYKGYYCIISNSRFYTGKTYNDQSQELSKLSLNPPLTNPTALPPQNTSTRYFIRKVNIFPITIKEVNEQTYNEYTNDPFYQLTFIGPNQTIEQADTQIPGLKIWLLG